MFCNAVVSCPGIYPYMHRLASEEDSIKEGSSPIVIQYAVANDI